MAWPGLEWQPAGELLAAGMGRCIDGKIKLWPEFFLRDDIIGDTF